MAGGTEQGHHGRSLFKYGIDGLALVQRLLHGGEGPVGSISEAHQQPAFHPTDADMVAVGLVALIELGGLGAQKRVAMEGKRPAGHASRPDLQIGSRGLRRQTELAPYLRAGSAIAVIQL